MVLFDRTDARAVRLTHAGDRLRERARRLLMDAAEAAREVRSLHHEVQGPLILGTLGTIAAYLLPDLLAGFMAQYPQAEVTIREDGNEGLYQAVHRGDLDLALVVVRPAPEVETITLLEDAVYLGVPCNHPLARRAQVPLAEVREEHFVLFQKGFALREMAEQACGAAGFSPRVAFESREMETVRALVRAGLGVTFLPGISGPGSGLAVLRLDPPLSRTLGLIRHPRRYLTPVARAWIDWCRTHLAAL